jgi:hypothetical protein
MHMHSQGEQSQCDSQRGSKHLASGVHAIGAGSRRSLLCSLIAGALLQGSAGNASPGIMVRLWDAQVLPGSYVC